MNVEELFAAFGSVPCVPTVDTVAVLATVAGTLAGAWTTNVRTADVPARQRADAARHRRHRRAVHPSALDTNVRPAGSTSVARDARGLRRPGVGDRQRVGGVGVRGDRARPGLDDRHVGAAGHVSTWPSAELFAGVGSGVVDDALAVLTIEAPATVEATVACTVIVADDPGLSSPIAHDTRRP